jgi:hypothetical protein
MGVDDVKVDPASGVHFMTVIEDEEAGRSVKTENSLRAVPIHPKLVRIGFIEFVDHVRTNGGKSVGSSRNSRWGPREASAKRSRNGLVATSAALVSPIRTVFFIHFDMASRMLCVLRV